MTETVACVYDSLARVAGCCSEGQIVAPVAVYAGAAAVVSKDDGRKPARSAADDERIALHEIGGHALVGRLLGSPIGGVSCEPADSDGASGLCWGPEFRSRFAGGDDELTFCEKIGPLMPGIGEPRADAANIWQHCFLRICELVAGSVAEAMFLPGEPWDAVDDRHQEHAYAALITNSPESAEAFIGFCMVEAAALLRPREHIVRALTKELLMKRTMTGAEIDEAISAAVTAKARADEQQRQSDWQRCIANAALLEKYIVQE